MNFRYINIKNIYPFDRHIIDGLRENGHKVDEVCISKEGFKKYIILIKIMLTGKQSYDAIFIGYPSPHFAVCAGIIGFLKRQKIIFNAVSTQYESNIISRGVKKFSFRAIKFWLIDFVSFHIVWKVLLESNSQIEYASTLTLTSPKKLIRSWTGVNEKDFFINPTVKKSDAFTVVFRGRFLCCRQPGHPLVRYDRLSCEDHIIDRDGRRLLNFTQTFPV